MRSWTPVLALLSGNHLVVMPRFDAAECLDLIERHRVDWMYAVPTMMHRLLALPRSQLIPPAFAPLNTLPNAFRAG